MRRPGRTKTTATIWTMLGCVFAQAFAGQLPASAQGGTALRAPCPALSIPFNRWTPLTTPRSPALPHVASFAQDPCTFVGATADGAVYRSTDAARWAPVVELDGLEAVRGIAAEEMPAGTAFVFGDPAAPLVGGDGAPVRAGGLYVSRNFGATFEPVSDLAGYSVTAVAAAPSDPQIIYAAASPSTPVRAPLVFKSNDFGRTWVPLPGSLAVRPTRLVVDARLPSVVWANSSTDGSAPAAGVWRSSDGGLTFTRVRDDVVVDFDAAPVPGGGGRVDMATAEGLVRTRDGGQTFRTVVPDAVMAVTHERFVPDAVMAVVGARAVRSTNAGRTFKETPGLSTLEGCTVTELTRDEEHPSYFLLSVAGCDAGGHYLYRSDGRDLLNAKDLGGDVDDPVLPAFGRLPRTDMRVLREVKLPVSGDNSSGSLAFDGEMLYYTNNEQSDRVHVATTTGTFVRTILVPRLDVRTLTYDPLIEKLWLLVNETGESEFPSIASMYTLDPATGDLTKAFRSPLDAETTLSVDPTTGVFRSYDHHGYQVHEISRLGGIVETCEVAGFPVDPNVSTDPSRGHPDQPAPGFASGLAVGDGRMYLQLEDDRTIYHVSKDCEILAVLEHRTFSESTGGPRARLENDQMACDTVTFGEPAIWIRDARVNTAVAYAVPNGYCPLDSKLAMTPEKLTAKSGETTRACAVLLGDGPNDTYMPVRQEELTFFAGDTPVATAITDRSGTACTTITAPGGGPKTVPLEAAFFGSIAFRPSSTTGTLDTFLPMTPEKPRAVPPPPLPRPPQVALVPPPPFPLPQVPASGGAQAQQPQQQPQSQAQQQTQMQSQAGFARQHQSQAQLAFAVSSTESHQLSEEYAMSERTDRRARLSLQGGAAVLMAVFGWCMTRGSFAVKKVRR